MSEEIERLKWRSWWIDRLAELPRDDQGEVNQDLLNATNNAGNFMKVVLDHKTLAVPKYRVMNTGGIDFRWNRGGRRVCLEFHHDSTTTVMFISSPSDNEWIRSRLVVDYWPSYKYLAAEISEYLVDPQGVLFGPQSAS